MTAVAELSNLLGHLIVCEARAGRAPAVLSGSKAGRCRDELASETACSSCDACECDAVERERKAGGANDARSDFNHF